VIGAEVEFRNVPIKIEGVLAAEMKKEPGECVQVGPALAGSSGGDEVNLAILIDANSIADQAARRICLEGWMDSPAGKKQGAGLDCDARSQACGGEGTGFRTPARWSGSRYKEPRWAGDKNSG